MHRRTFYCSVTTIHTTVAMIWLYHILAIFTLVKVLTRVCRHCFFPFMSAFWASDCRLKKYHSRSPLFSKFIFINFHILKIYNAYNTRFNFPFISVATSINFELSTVIIEATGFTAATSTLPLTYSCIITLLGNMDLILFSNLRAS